MALPSTTLSLEDPSEVRALATPSGARAEVEGEAIAIRSANGALVARFDATTGELLLSAPAGVTIASPGGRLALEARAIDLTAERVRVKVGAWVLDAERILERTTDALRTVDGLAETHARRMRTLVARTFELASRRTTIQSKEDTRIDGRRLFPRGEP